jgi:hypothetical protein
MEVSQVKEPWTRYTGCGLQTVPRDRGQEALLGREGPPASPQGVGIRKPGRLPRISCGRWDRLRFPYRILWGFIALVSYSKWKRGEGSPVFAWFWGLLSSSFILAIIVVSALQSEPGPLPDSLYLSIVLIAAVIATGGTWGLNKREKVSPRVQPMPPRQDLLPLSRFHK